MAKIQISQKKKKKIHLEGQIFFLEIGTGPPPPPPVHFYLRFENCCSHILLYRTQSAKKLQGTLVTYDIYLHTICFYLRQTKNNIYLLT